MQAFRPRRQSTLESCAACARRIAGLQRTFPLEPSPTIREFLLEGASNYRKRGGRRERIPWRRHPFHARRSQDGIEALRPDPAPLVYAATKVICAGTCFHSCGRNTRATVLTKSFHFDSSPFRCFFPAGVSR